MRGRGVYEEVRDQIGTQEYFDMSDLGGNLMRFSTAPLKEAVVVDVTNVAEFVRTSSLDGERSWTWEDVPNAAPPWPSFFLEFPDFMDDDYLKTNSAVGLWISGGRNIEGDWIVAAFHALRDVEGVIWPLMGSIFPVNKDGSLGNTQTFFDSPSPINTETASKNGFATIALINPRLDPESEDVHQILQKRGSALNLALIAVSFIHCKNVEVVPTRRAKLYARANRSAPKVLYHKLVIEPITRVLREEGRSETIGLKQALHICRGHFKDYRERGLFGKYKGLYWWEQHVRGSADQGIVEKDYIVSPSSP